MELMENTQPLATHDGNQGVNFLCLQLFQQLIGQVDFPFIYGVDLKRIHPGRLAKDPVCGGIEVFDKLGAEGNQSTIRMTIGVQRQVAILYGDPSIRPSCNF